MTSKAVFSWEESVKRLSWALFMVLNLAVTLSRAGGHKKMNKTMEMRGLEARAGKEGISETGNLFELLVLGTSRVCQCRGYVVRLWRRFNLSHWRTKSLAKDPELH